MKNNISFVSAYFIATVIALLCAWPQSAQAYTLSGYSWTGTSLSVSFMPDGTLSDSAIPTNLFAELNSRYQPVDWQREFARALQTWASVAPINFYFVVDSGLNIGAPGIMQGDSRVGDIRFGGYGSESSYLAYSYYPKNNSSTIAGDVILNTNKAWRISSLGTAYGPDLYSIVLHEIGHALGLEHGETGTVMYPSIKGVYNGLSADDIAGIQAIYGPRQEDRYDAQNQNGTINSATPLTVNTVGTAEVVADLTRTTDIDYYKVIAPAGIDGNLMVLVDPSKLSLLAAKVAVVDGNGKQLGTQSADYGKLCGVSLSGLHAGDTIYIAVVGSTSDVFAIGAYKLNVSFGLNLQPTVKTTTSTITTTTLSAAAIDSALDLTLSDARFYFNAQGISEKWLRGKDTTGNEGWYFILPNGSLYRWSGTVASSSLVVKLDPSYYVDPYLLIEAALRESQQPSASTLDLEYQLSVDPGGFYINSQNFGEKWLRGKNLGAGNGGWYFILPTGTLYRWQGTIAASIPVAHLNPAIHSDPFLLTEAAVRNALPPTAISLQSKYSFTMRNGSWSTNTWGQKEKWFPGTVLNPMNAGWYFILPNGQLYAWNGAMWSSDLIAMLDPSYYANPLLLTEAAVLAQTPLSASSTDATYRLSTPATGYCMNCSGYDEKYLQGIILNSTNAGWYFITPNGILYSWNGDIASSKQIGFLGKQYYDDPTLLTNAASNG